MEELQIRRVVEKYRFELIQTHISWVLLGEDLVYKIKKPVDFGFLDYTTLERRRSFCEKEIKLNRRLAEDIYLGVSKVTEKKGDISIDGDGKVIDYAVRMKRMPQDRMMDVLIENDEIDESHIVALAKKIAEFHLKAETNDYIASFGSVEINKFNTDENFEQTKDGVGEFLTEYQYKSIKDFTNRFYKEKATLFERRVRDGKIRDCHGDLYSHNICIIDEKTIWVYDCIEFNERFRYSDVASDVAFLLMDLENYSKYDLSELFFDEYLEFSKDYGMDDIIGFYKIYRAYVRGKIAYFQSQKEQAKLYFDLAFGYLPNSYKPRVVVISGLTGSGKSSVAEAISSRRNFIVVSSDVVRKKLAGMELYDKDLSAYGKGIYTEEMTKRVYDSMINEAYDLVREGNNVIIDATFIKKWQRDKVFKKFKRIGIEPFLVFIEVDDKTAIDHLEKRKREKSVSNGRYEIFLRQREELEKPQEAFIVDGREEVSKIAKRITDRVGV